MAWQRRPARLDRGMRDREDRRGEQSVDRGGISFEDNGMIFASESRGGSLAVVRDLIHAVTRSIEDINFEDVKHRHGRRNKLVRVPTRQE